MALVLWLTVDQRPGFWVQEFLAGKGLILGAPAAEARLTLAPLQPGALPVRLYIYNLTANLLLFIPLGFLLAGAYGTDRFWIKAGACALFSLSIEMVQLLLVGRAADINDLITNTLGAAMGLAWRTCFGFRIFPFGRPGK